MVINIFEIVGILGVLSIIVGTFMISIRKRVQRKYIYPFLLFGGICLIFYSCYIGDIIFIILQSAYVAIVIYDIIKLKVSK